MKNRKMIYLDDAIDAVSKAYHELRGIFGECEDGLLALPSAVVMCKDCIHRPIIDDPDAKDGFGLLFPDFECPCRCDDPYYSLMPKDNWFCGNGEKEAVNDE